MQSYMGTASYMYKDSLTKVCRCLDSQ